MKRSALYINGNSVIQTGDVCYNTRRGLNPGRFTFNTLDRVAVGDNVIFYGEGKSIFKGTVFTVSKTNSGYECLAYDLLRYFKNKTTILYSDKTAGELLTILCNGFGIPTGMIADTKMKISAQIDDGRELFSIIENALSLTSLAGYGDYILYDDFGKICLSDADSLNQGVTIYPQICREFTVTESIDENVYNDVSLIETTENGRVYHQFRDDGSIARYGHLSYLRTLSFVENATATGTGILSSSALPLTTVKCETIDLVLQIRSGAAVDVLIGDEKKRMICEESELIYGLCGSSTKLTLSSV